MEFILFVLSNIIYLFFYLVFLIIFAIIGAIVAGPARFYKNERTGHTKVIRRGFSFTYLFFGPFVPLIRGHFSSFAIALIIELLSFSIARFVYIFVINKTYTNKLLNDGYVEISPQYMATGNVDVIDID